MAKTTRELWSPEDEQAARWWQTLAPEEKQEHLHSLLLLFLDVVKTKLPARQQAQRLADMRDSLRRCCGDDAVAQTNLQIMAAAIASVEGKSYRS
jgi:hypothetical protein